MAGKQSLEEIRLQIENVKYKKVEGTLYLMSERIAWMPKQKNVFTASHHYVDIKTQKISPEGNSKIQLQVVLHDDTSSTFHFLSAAGPQQQLKDREKVKDLLATLLPQFKQKISKELEEKKRILLENPQVYQLYNDLVVGQVVSAEDFWKNYVNFEEFKLETKNQTTGVSQGFMSHICPKSDGSNGLIFNISFDDIQSIFKTYPAVKTKYAQNVPHKMTENEFWTKFFQSYYFRKDQISTQSKDFFADCAAKEEQEQKQLAQKTLIDPVDIVESQKDLSIEDGFGLTDFVSNKATTLSNQNLIKRYNYYSMRVLNSMKENSAKDKANNIASESLHKKMRLDEEISDLISDGNNNSLKGAELNLAHVDRYFHGLNSSEANTSNFESILKNQNPQLLTDKTLNEISDWNLNVDNFKNPSLAIGILVELSPGSQLMQSNGVQNLKDEIPKINQEEIKLLYISSCEMLRHFWACFPPKNPQLEIKLKLMKDTLECFYKQKILVLNERLVKDQSSWDLTGHLNNMFKIALLKYNSWIMKTT